MKRLTVFVTAITAALFLASVPVLAQHGGNASGGSHGAAAMHDSTHSSHAETGKENHTPTGKSVSNHLQENTKLRSKLESLLGLSGPNADTQLQADAAGFRNLGQFVAAVHVSRNLDIPFADLKGKVVGPPSESLGKAIKQLRPEANSKTEVRKAHKQADDDSKETNS